MSRRNRAKSLIIIAAIAALSGTNLLAQELDLDAASALMRRNRIAPDARQAVSHTAAENDNR